MSDEYDRSPRVKKFLKDIGLSENTEITYEEIYEDEAAEGWVFDHQHEDVSYRGDREVFLTYDDGSEPPDSFMFLAIVKTDTFHLLFEGDASFSCDQHRSSTYPENWGVYHLYDWVVKNLRFEFKYTDRFTGKLDKVVTASWQLCRFSDYFLPDPLDKKCCRFIKCTSLCKDEADSSS